MFFYLTFSNSESLCVHYSEEHCSLRADATDSKVWFPSEVRAHGTHTILQTAAEFRVFTAPGPSAAPLWRVSVLYAHTHALPLAVAAPAGEFETLHLMLERVFLHLGFR